MTTASVMSFVNGLSPMAFFALMFFGLSGALLLIKRVFYGRRIRAEVMHVILIFLITLAAWHYVQTGTNPITSFIASATNAVKSLLLN